MKKLFTLLIIMALSIVGIAQSPQKMSYQAVVRNTSGVLMANQAVGMKISILQGSATGIPVYVETQTTITNANGLATIEIGGGTIVIGTFAGIDWSSGVYFIKTETDLTGGTSYTITGVSQILSVPYALYSKTAKTADYNDLTNKPVLFDGTWTSLTGKPLYAIVATSGSYNDLLNKPTLFSGIWADITGKPTTLIGFGITDGMSTAHVANGITSNMVTNWNTAFSWGNHEGLYKLNSYVPTWVEITGKPTFASVATSGIFADLLSKPTTLAGYGITDAISTLHPTNSITTTNITDWSTAYSWGNHATAGYQPSITAGTVTQYWRGDKTWQELNKAAVGLGNVENVQLSTWAGTNNISTLGIITSGIWNAGAVTSSGTITANIIVKTGGTSSQFLKADGSVDENNYLTSIMEVTDEFSATTGQTNFTLTQIPPVTSKVKMYINGVRISNTAYSVTGNALTYFPSNNGSYALMDGDRIQLDYTY